MEKTILLIGITIAIVALSGCPQPMPDSSSCEKIHNDQNSIDTCYQRTGSLAGDLSICDKIQNQDKKDYCYQSVAQTKKDVTICDKIQSKSPKEFCYSYLAEKNQDISICNKLNYEPGGFRSWCYAKVALSKEDNSICDKAPEPIEKDWCYSYIAGQNLVICDKIKDQFWKDSCYGNVAGKKLDTSICEKIQQQTNKEECYLKVAVELARMQEACKRIETEKQEACKSWKGRCENTEGYGSLVELEVCKGLEATCKSTEDSYCQEYLSGTKSGIGSCLEICDQIQEETKKARCYSRVAREKEDYSICETFQETNLKQICTNPNS